MLHLLNYNFWLYVALFLGAGSAILFPVLIERKRLISAKKAKISESVAAGLCVRCFAQIADVFLATGVGVLVFGLLYGGVLFKYSLLPGYVEVWVSRNSKWLLSVVIIAVHFLHSVTFTTAFGGTLGKMLLKICIETTDGRQITHRMAALRYAAYILLFISAGYGFIDLARNREKRGLHDRICGTKVIYIGVSNLSIMIGILFVLFLIGLLSPESFCCATSP